MFPDMGEKTVISIVLKNILKTISDGDLLDRQRCLMLHGSLIFFFYHSPLSIPSTTRYHSVRIFIPLLTIYTTTGTTLNKTTTLSLLNKNANLEILFIQSPVNVIFMMEEIGSCMAGTSM